MSEGGLQGCRPPFSFNHPNFNYGEFAIIKSQEGLNSYKISVKVIITSILMR